jgi:Concanavalin A-like lectin/glucanases superfamily
MAYERMTGLRGRATSRWMAGSAGAIVAVVGAALMTGPGACFLNTEGIGSGGASSGTTTAASSTSSGTTTSSSTTGSTTTSSSSTSTTSSTSGGCQPASCDDQNDCTTDSCGSDGGCEHTAVADGTVCGNTHGSCAGGACVCAQTFAGMECASCAPGYVGYPACVKCQADTDCTTPAAPFCDPTTNTCSYRKPVAIYHFDEGTGTTFLDATPNHLDGTHNAAYVAGKKGNALQFNGTNIGTVPGSSLLTWGNSNEDFSVVYWINVASASTTYQFVVHHGSTDCSTGDRTSAHFLQPSGQVLNVQASTTMSCNEGVTVPVFDNTWVHIAQVKAGSQHLVYVNGTPAPGVAINPTVGNMGPLYVGKDPWYGGLIGAIDELAIYRGALTASDVQALASGVGP